ncbi:dirigent protein 22 [Brachypodium distachyon]|nr:dirigent protein 22 [Brachypodium distachyon]|eukprot:XP_003578858.1 dirigent protein 22 [Brachypodium distachyon]
MAAVAALSAVLVLLVTAVPGAQATASPSTPKTTHIKLLWHEVVSGRHPTAIQVAGAATTNSSKSFFGAVYVTDDLLTTTDKVPGGRSQGTYASASKDAFALLMAMNFVFTAGEYNGSSIAIFGRNEVQAGVREMPIVGGTGVFRWARGYALASTRKFNLKTGDADVEYNLFIRHE